jgi:hypothetical protein
MSAEECGQLCLARVVRPLGWGSLVEDVPDIETTPSLDEEFDNVFVTGQSCLVQRRRRRMGALRIEAIRIFAQVEKQPDDVCVAELRGPRQRQMAALGCGVWSRLACLSKTTGRRGRREIDCCTSSNQRVCGFELSVRERGSHCAARLRSVVTQQIYECDLDIAFAGHSS